MLLYEFYALLVFLLFTSQTVLSAFLTHYTRAATGHTEVNGLCDSKIDHMLVTVLDRLKWTAMFYLVIHSHCDPCAHTDTLFLI